MRKFNVFIYYAVYPRHGIHFVLRLATQHQVQVQCTTTSLVICLQNLFTEEIHRKSTDGKKDGDAHVASDRQRGRTRGRAKSKEHGGSCSKYRGSMRNVECYHCHRKGHVKKDCRAWQKSVKKEQSSEASKPKSDDAHKGKAKVEKVNVVESPNAHVVVKALSEGYMPLTSDVLVFLADLSEEALVIVDIEYAQNWVIDSGASFHVTPHREWLSTYSHNSGKVRLGNAYELDIEGVRNVKLHLTDDTQFMLHNVRTCTQIDEKFDSCWST